uniref:Uncharacterized protein n=1 Tax=Pseudomonas phage KV2023 TaxID=3234047 RepID=A0AB39C6U5_9CAUD
MVTPVGLEPTTSCVQDRHSNQLSYEELMVVEGRN